MDKQDFQEARPIFRTVIAVVFGAIMVARANGPISAAQVEATFGVADSYLDQLEKDLGL